MIIYDISADILKAPVYPGDPEPRLDRVETLGRGSDCNLSALYCCLHNGTHADAPLHFIENGETVVVAGGTGVSPVRGVIDALSRTADAKDKHVIAGFRSPDDILFRKDLERWDGLLDLILTVDGAPEGYQGNVGLVTKYIADLPLKDAASARAVVVGPPPMMKFTIIEFLKKGFQEENIWVSQERKMCCGLGKCGHCRIGSKYVCVDGPVFNYTESKLLID